jgi:hypothetical protein
MNTDDIVLRMLRDLITTGCDPMNIHESVIIELYSKFSRSSRNNFIDAISMLKKNGYADQVLMGEEYYNAHAIHPMDRNDYWTIRWTQQGLSRLAIWMEGIREAEQEAI